MNSPSTPPSGADQRPSTPKDAQFQQLDNNSPDLDTSRPPSVNSIASSTASSGKSPCRQCHILRRRMRAEAVRSSSLLSRSLSCGQGQCETPLAQSSPQRSAPAADKPRSVNRQTVSETPPRAQASSQSSLQPPPLAPRELFPAEDTTTAKEEQQQPEQLVTETPRDTGKMATNTGLSGALALAFVYTSSLLVLFTLVYRVQPVAFIDELFHVGQAQKYCREDRFSSWDSKITTPPGLYLVSYAIIRPIAMLFAIPLDTACSIVNLRLTNVAFSVGNFIIIAAILQAKLATSRQSTTNTLDHIVLCAITLALLPPLFFFSFLYYTDPGSMFTILLTQWFALKGHHGLAGYAGFASLWFRQTNIVWIFLAAGLCSVNIIFNLIEDVLSYRKFQFFLFGFTKRFSIRECTLSNWRYSACLLYDLFISVLATCGGYLLNGMLFIAFLYLNDGIVLGDRSAHQAVLHLAQIPYFLTFVGFIGAPVIFTLSNLRTFWRLAGSARGVLVILFTSGFLFWSLSDDFKYVHPYLLADNRHYAFYIWRRLWSNPNYPELRFLPIPLYVFTLTTMWCCLDLVPQPPPVPPKKKTATKVATLRALQHQLAKLLFSLTTAVTIVPQQLIEFRYFLVPYLLWRLNIKQPSSRLSLVMELLWAIFINAATMYLFTMKTIKYSEAEPHSRLIW